MTTHGWTWMSAFGRDDAGGLGQPTSRQVSGRALVKKASGH